jgi:branched-chain amino acid transport system substrate-binding protein
VSLRQTAKFALLIGISEYEPGLEPLPSASRDIAALKQVLIHPDIGGFTDVIALTNPQV